MPDFPFKWSASFVVADTRVTVVVESDTRNVPEHRYVSFTGTMEGGGQIVDRLRELAAPIEGASDVIELCDAWDSMHLNPILELSPERLAELDTVQTLLVLVNGERYGSAVEFEDIDDADFSNASDVIDSRDVIKRIEVLSGAFEAAGLDFANLDLDSLPEDIREAVSDAADELKALKALEDEAEPYAADWQHGETLIRESYFETYAEELASDIGAINKEAQWPLNHIDWTAAADALKMDYTEVSFDGVTYYVR